MSDYKKIDSYLDKNLDQSLEELQTLCVTAEHQRTKFGIERMRADRKRNAGEARI